MRDQKKRYQAMARSGKTSYRADGETIFLGFPEKPANYLKTEKKEVFLEKGCTSDASLSDVSYKQSLKDETTFKKGFGCSIKRGHLKHYYRLVYSLIK